MRPSRVFRWIVRAFLLVFTLSLSAVSILGGWSAVTILNPSSDDINIPDGPIGYNINIGNSSVQITIPFNISNGGVYELSNVELGLQFDMRFENISAGNATTTFTVFNVIHYYGNILPGATLKANLTGFGTLPLSDVNTDRNPDLDLFIGLLFSASYSLNLYTFTVGIVNVSIGTYDIP
ncbi:MAG: hypothetical protein EAX91_03590 [Candidatus Lokiarchaeota archaeon]|nr:hypothetical protein [Candidatus Lokiarchaeota archaeon]